MRLHKYLASCTDASRRRAELLIQGGCVRVNGKTLTSLGASVKTGDRIEVNGEAVYLPEPLTIGFHKPRGIITSTHDTHDRLTVADLLPRSLRLRGLLPVGRLDQDTDGLLILTNLGDLNHRVTHPSFELEKEYRAIVRGTPGDRALASLEKGVVIDGVRTAPARIVGAGPRGRGLTAVDLIIHEGRKRQVRRMFQAVGHEVEELRRTRVGGVKLGDLEPGTWRPLDRDELASLAPDHEAILASYLRVRDSVAPRPVSAGIPDGARDGTRDGAPGSGALETRDD